MSEVFLIGRPNVGKSYLFNRLTMADQKIANFAGVTVDKKSKKIVNSDITLTDLPGIYALNNSSNEEEITSHNLKNSSPEDLICLVVESLKIKTQIHYILEVRNWCEKNLRPMVLCLNMKDEADKYDVHIDIQKLSELIKIPVFFVSAKKNEGIKTLRTFFLNQFWLPPEPLETQFDPQKKINNIVSGDFSKIIRTQSKVDEFILSPIWGPLIFLVFTFILFQSIFSWAEPLMNIIESLLEYLASISSPYFTGHLKSFIDNAFFAGFGAFLVFTPQIFILTFILTVLEKSGYMARAVLLCHQPLSWFGLHGKSFIPLMTGHACAVPAIYSTRNIESTWIKKLTIFVIPLTVCSARIPVYGLLIKLLIPNHTVLYGLFGTQGLAFFIMYFFGIFMALFMSALITKFSKQKAVNDDFILELPHYRFPEPRLVITKAINTTFDFIKEAGPIIFVLNSIIWALSYFPNGTGGFKTSYLAQVGQYLEPIFKPIGLDWIQGVAVLSSFVAREVFVSTLGLLYGLNTDNVSDILQINAIQNISLASGLSLLFFFAIALQCMSTVSVMAKEASKKTAYTALITYLILAYIVSFTTYQVLK